MSDFVRRNAGLLIAGALVLFLTGLVVFQISYPSAPPLLTQVSTSTLTHMPRPTPTPSPSITLLERPTRTLTLSPASSETCQPARDLLQAVLQAAIPHYFWGVHYQVAAFPELYFFGVNNGETKTITVAGPSGNSWDLDLARLYYLRADGTLDALWATLGFAHSANSPSTPTSYYTFNDMGDEGWFSSQEARARLSVPGQVFFLAFPEKFIDRSSVHWDQCRATVQIIPKAACDLGPILDPDGSAQFFSTGVPPEDWIAFGFYETPNDKNSYVDPIPNTVTIPEAICP